MNPPVVRYCGSLQIVMYFDYWEEGNEPVLYGSIALTSGRLWKFDKLQTHIPLDFSDKSWDTMAEEVLHASVIMAPNRFADEISASVEVVNDKYVITRPVVEEGEPE